MASTNNTRQSLPKRILSSVWFKTLVFAVVFVLLTTFMTGSAGTKINDKQLEFLEDAVRRSAVQCYALEGSFPNSLAYLEENYGLIIDHKNYAVYYEPVGGNLIPQIIVIPLNH